MRVYSRFCRSKVLTIFLLNHFLDPVASDQNEELEKWKRREIIVAEYKRIVEKGSCKRRNNKAQNEVWWEDTKLIIRKSLMQ